MSSAIAPAIPRPLVVSTPPAPASQGAPATSEPPLKDTPYQKIKNSPIGRFVRENKALTTIAGVGSSIVVAGASYQSPAFEQVARYGIVPAVGAGVAIVGATAVHDAIVNDLGNHTGRGVGKMVGGSLAALGGAEVVGDTFGIPVLDRALSGTLEAMVNHGEALAGVAVAGGGLAAGRFALERFAAAARPGEHRAANALLGVTGSAAAVGGLLGGAELIGRQYGIAGLNHVFTGTIETLARTGTGAVSAGALLAAGSLVLAQEAVANVGKNGNGLVTVAEGMGAVTTGLGGAELVGHGLGIEALKGLFTQHLGVIGAAGLSSTGVAITADAVHSIRQNGLTPGNTTSSTTGATMTVGGLALAADTLGFNAAAHTLGHGSAVAAGLGLCGVTAALGRSAVQRFRKGDLVGGLATAAATPFTAATGLGLAGYGLGIDAMTRVAGEVFDHGVVPVFDHVIAPAARFLFENPVAGAVVLAAGVGAYAWYRHGKKPAMP